MPPKQQKEPDKGKLPKMASSPPKGSGQQPKAGGATSATRSPTKLPQIASASPEKTTADAETAASAALAAAESEAAAAAAAAAAAEVAAAEAAAAAAAAEAEALRIASNGSVTLLYEMYKEPFEIIDGSIATAVVDETYCLSDVMPGCVIHLSKYDSRTRRAMEDDPTVSLSGLFLQEDQGRFLGMRKDESYHVVIEQQAEQLKRDQEMMKRRASRRAEPNASEASETAAANSLVRSAS